MPWQPGMPRPSWADAVEYLGLVLATYIQRMFGFVIDNRMETYQYVVETPIPATQALAYARGVSNTGVIEITAEADFIATYFTGLEEVLLADTGNGNNVSRVGAILVSPTTNLAFTTASTFAPPTNGPGAWDYVITDGSTDRQMSNAAVHAYAGIGIGCFPWHLPKPRLFKRNSNIRFTFRLRHPAVGGGATLSEQVNIIFQAHGYKVYDRSALDLTSRV